MCLPALAAVPIATWLAAGTAVVSAGAGLAAAHMSSIAQGQQADKASQEAAAVGTAQKGTAADTSQVNAGGQPAAVGVNSGPASTLLTGSSGVSNSALNLGGTPGLGSNTLLGS